MGNDQKDVAIKKYNAIAKANRMMFGAVALASVVAGAAVVGMSFLIRDINFNAKVISKQDETLNNIKKSTESIEGSDGLKVKIKGLQTDQNLLASRASDEDNALRVILDALPSDANATAVAASLSEKILKIDNLTVESMTVEPVVETADGSTASTGTSTTSSSTTTNPNDPQSAEALSAKLKTIKFSFNVTSSSAEVLNEVLLRMERSIRTFRVESFKFEKGKESISLNISGVAYYLPIDSLSLTSTTVKSEETKKSTTSSSSTQGGTQ